jgi:hypothetical protein
MVTLALLALTLSAKPQIVCVGLTSPECSFTYASSEQAEQHPEVLKWADVGGWPTFAVFAKVGLEEFTSVQYRFSSLPVAIN